MANETINKIGMAVELYEGAEVISTLRAIRAEYQAIIALGGQIKSSPRSSGAAGTSDKINDPRQQSLYWKEEGRLFDDVEKGKTKSYKNELNERERAYLDSQRRMKRQREQEEQASRREASRIARITGPVTKEDVKINAAAANRRDTLKQETEIERERQRIRADFRRKDESLNDAINRRGQERSGFRNRRDEDGLTKLIEYQTVAVNRNRQAMVEAIRTREEFLTKRLTNYQNEIRPDVERRVGTNTQQYSKTQSDIFRRARFDPAATDDPISVGYRLDYARDVRANRIEAQRQRKADREREEREEAEAQRKRDSILSLNQRINERGEAERARKERESADKLRRERREREETENRINAVGSNRQAAVAAIENQIQRNAAKNVAKAGAVNNLQSRLALPGGEGLGRIDDLIKQTDKLTDSTIRYRNTVAQKTSNVKDKDIQADSIAIQKSLTSLGQQSIQLGKELRAPSFTRPRQEIIADLRAVDRAVDQEIQKFRELQIVAGRPINVGPGGGGPPRRPGGNRGPDGLGDPSGLLNERGFFTSGDALGRITRNILLYEAVSAASYGLVDYIGKSIQAAKTTVEFSNALRFATESADGNLEANNRLVESIRPLGLSRQQSRAAVTEAARFTEDRPQDIDKLTEIVANIAAERGGGIDRTDELIEQLRRRESKFYKRIFGTTVESIYEREAAKVIDQQAIIDPTLTIGKDSDNFKTRDEKIKSYVAAMDDAAKENATLNFIISQGNRFQGEAAERANTLAGRLDKLSAASLNAQEGIGLFITEIKPISDLLDALTGKVGVLDKLRAPEIGRSGPGGRITEFDAQKFATEKTTGTRADILQGLADYGATGLAGIAGIGGAALFGRRQATQNYRANVRDDFIKNNLGKFDNDIALTQKEAIEVARNAKPGFVRSVGSGFQRITVGMSQGVLDLSAAASQKIGADTAAAKARLLSQTIGGTLGPNATVFGGASFNRDNPRFNPIAGSSGPYSLIQQPVNPNYGNTGAIAGGLAGGLAGAEIGNLIAQSISAGPITATGLTILGGIAGTAVGTALGNAAGTLVGEAASNPGGVIEGAKALFAGIKKLPIVGLVVAGGVAAGAGIGTAVNRAIPSYVPFLGRVSQEREDEAELRRQDILSGLNRERAKERQQDIRDGKLRYQSLDVGGPTSSLTPAELVLRGDAIGDGKGGFKNYIETSSTADLLNVSKETIADSARLKTTREFFQKQQADLQQLIKDTDGLSAEIKTRRLNELIAQQDNSVNPKFQLFLDDYRKRASERELDRKAKEQREAEQEAAKKDKQKQDYINDQSSALAKLREAQQGSFRLVGEIATGQTGPDNRFVKVLSDQATAAQRMRQQWSFLGDAAVDYFTKLEQRVNSVEIVKTSFDNLARSLQTVNQLERESEERYGPGFSRRQEQGANVFNAARDAAISIPELRRRELEISGQNLRGTRYEDPDFVPMQQVVGLGRAFLQGIGNGGDNRQISALYAESVIGATNNLSGQQIANNPYLRTVVGEAIRIQRAEAEAKVEDEIQKIQFFDNEDKRIQNDLKASENRRQELIRQGIDPAFANRELNRFIISRTDGISPKDLTFEQFQQRQNALRDEAKAIVDEEKEARAAIKKGLEYQQLMTGELKIIREAIIGGNVSMLVQVQNDTQARIDQEDLQEAGGVGYNVPRRSRTNQNPYSSEFNRYGRGGNPQ